jgi:general secretion pathway protein J
VTVRARGFTLIEVMIAIGITAIVAAMAAGTIREIDRASDMARVQNDRYAGARVALSRVGHELSMAFLSDNFDNKRYRERPTLFVGREDELLFTTFAHERLYRDAKESDQAVVAYTVERDPDHPGEEALFRRAKARIDDEPDRGGRRDLVADHLRTFRIRYWDEKRRDWAREWTTRSTEHASELPRRVRIEMEVALADGRIEKFVTEARIELRDVLGWK